jgi:N-acetylglucosamine-6-phosphate deacetylase
MGTDKMRLLLRADRIVTPDDDLTPGWIAIEQGLIAAVGRGDAPPAERVEVLRNATLVPGFVDVHVHGGGGYSLATTDAREIEEYAKWAARTGVTSFLATVVAASLEEGLGFGRTVAGATTKAGANIIGANFEGPFVSRERPGALPPSWPAAPDAEAFERIWQACGGKLRLMTVAPELDGSNEVMSLAVQKGIKASIGHTDIGYEGALAAFSSGASHLTHAFNAMRPFHHRDPGPIGAALHSDNVTVELIADGVHLHRATVRLLVGAFGPKRIALVTDATPLAGAAEGSFRIGSIEAQVRGGRATLADGTIAGSVATMDEIVRNIVAWGVCDLSGAVRMASTVPAAVGGLGGRKGRIATGFDADIVALGPEFQVVASWVSGETAYAVKKQ